MARVTVEDCLNHVDNRFDLVLLATKRARQLVNGVAPLLPWENDKPTVMALREIAAGLVDDKAIHERDQAAETQVAEEEEMMGMAKAAIQPLDAGDQGDSVKE